MSAMLGESNYDQISLVIAGHILFEPTQPDVNCLLNQTKGWFSRLSWSFRLHLIFPYAYQGPWAEILNEHYWFIVKNSVMNEYT